MRPLIIGLVLVITAGVGVVIADLIAPSFIEIIPGSVGVEPDAGGLELLPVEVDCDPAENTEPCRRRYAFRAADSLVAWVSVRNNGPLAIELLGISPRWLGQFANPRLLAQPVSGLDGGDPSQGLESIQSTPVEPVALHPGDERLVGVEFITIDDLGYACDHWLDGGGLEWEGATISWRWLVVEHEHEAAFAEPIAFMAPTADECS